MKRGFFLLFLAAVVAQTQSMKIEKSDGAAWPSGTKLDDRMLLLEDERPKNDEIFDEVNRRKKVVRDKKEQLQWTVKKNEWSILGFAKSAVLTAAVSMVLVGAVEATGFEPVEELCECPHGHGRYHCIAWISVRGFFSGYYDYCAESVLCDCTEFMK